MDNRGSTKPKILYYFSHKLCTVPCLVAHLVTYHTALGCEVLRSKCIFISLFFLLTLLVRFSVGSMPFSVEQQPFNATQQNTYKKHDAQIDTTGMNLQWALVARNTWEKPVAQTAEFMKLQKCSCDVNVLKMSVKKIHHQYIEHILNMISVLSILFWLLICFYRLIVTVCLYMCLYDSCIIRIWPNSE